MTSTTKSTEYRTIKAAHEALKAERRAAKQAKRAARREAKLQQSALTKQASTIADVIAFNEAYKQHQAEVKALLEKLGRAETEDEYYDRLAEQHEASIEYSTTTEFDY